MGGDTLDGTYGQDECQGGPQNDTFSNCDCGNEGTLPPSPQAGGETDAGLDPCI